MPAHILGARYELGEMIGTGGMSDVYRAKDTLLGREVAVKIMRADLARDDGFQERFRMEAQNGGSLNHPAIVAVYDTGSTELHGITVPYIVMELVTGKTLRSIIKEDAPLAPEQAAKIMVPVCEALQVSHDAGIIHRDVKPANIMITPTGDVKVMDFGIARALGDSTSSVTATSAVIGTAQYLSPEQARGKRADTRSDIYAAGCVFYELLTGTAPFAGDSPLAVAYQHVQEEAAPPSELIRGLSPTAAVNVDAVCLTAMAKHPGDRYQTAAEFAEDLRRVERGSVAMAARSHLGNEPQADSTPTTEIPPQTAALAHQGGQKTQAADYAPEPPKVTDSFPSAPPAPEPMHPRSSGSGPWGTVVAILTVLALLAGGGYFAYDHFSDTSTKEKGKQTSENVAVPNVADQTENEASTALEKLGFKVERKEEPSPTVPKGRVISTNPAVGSQVRHGATITLLVSSGKEIIEVPDLRGLTTEEASKSLIDAGLSLDASVKEEASDTVPTGQVMEQSPGAGSQVSKGSKVVITVSSGQEEVRVPNVVGMQLSAAESTLADLGLTPEVTYVTGSEAEGTVISIAQSGQTLPKGSVVTLEVSNGQSLSLPDLSGLTVPQALRTLKESGWTAPDTSLQQRKVPTTALVDQGKIAGQSPGPGEAAAPDAMIYVDVYDFQLVLIP